MTVTEAYNHSLVVLSELSTKLNQITLNEFPPTPEAERLEQKRIKEQTNKINDYNKNVVQELKQMLNNQLTDFVETRLTIR